MPKPATLNELVKVIRASRLVPESRLQDVLGQQLAAEPGRATVGGLLDRLIDGGAVTPFQAAQIARGKSRGLVLGQYRLMEPIGQGGMGYVFLAEHEHTGQLVAVKVLKAGAVGGHTARARLLREAQSATAISHPNVVRVYDVEPVGDPPYLVMEYVDGVTLQAAVARRGTLPAGLAADLGAQVARGLQAAADAGLVHRDIKPANVLIDRDGRCKILDLGIVRVAGSGDLTLDAGCRTILGTADYLAPEQAADSSNVDCRADIYALGATLYFLLTGAPPFPDGNSIAIMLAKQSRDAPPIDDRRPGLPEGLVAAVHRFVARDPAGRPDTPTAAAALLSPFARPNPAFVAALFVPMPPAADATPTADEAECPPTDAVTVIVTPTVPPDCDKPTEVILVPIPLVRPPTRRASAAWIAAGVVAGLGVVALTAAVAGRTPRPIAPPPGPAVEGTR